MNLAINDLDNGRRFPEATAEELNAVTGGFNYSLWSGDRGYGVIFFPTGIAFCTVDGKCGFVPNK
jgi:hypothetical protein